MTKHQNKRGRRPLNRQNNPMGARTPTVTWNTLSQATPAMTRVQINDMRPYTFCQLLDIGPILTSSSGGATFYGTAFNANQLTQISSIQNLFDQYRIDELEVWITPTYSASVGGGAASAAIYSAIDYDSSATPGSINQIMQYQNVIETQPTCGHYRRWKPRVGMAVGVPTATTQGMGNIVSPWIDSLTPSVNQNGLLLAMTASSVTTVLSLRVRFTISVRNVF